MQQREESLAAIANRKVAFIKAVGWVGTLTGERDRGMKVTCPVCGASGAMRVYADHGYCFAEHTKFSVVSLLAEVWDLEREDAAQKALDMIGYVPVTYAQLWEDSQREPEPAREDLATALRTWCEANCTDWKRRQYERVVSDKLSRCLGVLPRMRTPEQCERWLAVSKQVMGRALSLP